MKYRSSTAPWGWTHPRPCGPTANPKSTSSTTAGIKWRGTTEARIGATKATAATTSNPVKSKVTMRHPRTELVVRRNIMSSSVTGNADPPAAAL